MANYPQNATGLNYIGYPVGPTTIGLTITANASNNTKGSYSEFVASSTFASNRIQVSVGAGGTAASRRYLIDIATGGSGSEIVVIPDLLCDTCSAGSSLEAGSLWDLPLAIANSTRIAARQQCSTGSTNLDLGIVLIAAGGTPGLSSYTSSGTDATDSSGVSVDPGGTANTKGAYAEITSSLGAVAQVLTIEFGHNGSATNGASQRWLIDLATGGSGSEVVLIPDVRTTRGFNSFFFNQSPRSQTVLTYIAAGTRIAIRCSCSSNTATVRLLDTAILSGVAPSESSGGGGAWAFA